uniref:Uncharacterized protein n=1 Tax=Rhizophora mucronata TaxID=61149 RepID=A0A2P2QGL5_RHIMU
MIQKPINILSLNSFSKAIIDHNTFN